MYKFQHILSPKKVDYKLTRTLAPSFTNERDEFLF